MWAAEMKVSMFCDVTEIIYLISIVIIPFFCESASCLWFSYRLIIIQLLMICLSKKSQDCSEDESLGGKSSS